MVRGWLLVLLVLTGMVGLTGPGAVDAQADDEAALERATYKLFRLQEKGLFDVLYERTHPDVKKVVPEDAVIGWQRFEFANKRTSELTIDEIEVDAWTWEVTGKSYDEAGTVTYIHRFWMDGESYQEPGIFHFVKHKGEWAWFFGETKRFVDRQIARFGDPESASASPFRNEFDADVDRYWARIFADVDRDYLPPKAIVGFDAEVGTGCGPADPLMSPAFYCPFDESIYYVIDFRREITGDMGDYAWVSVVAHEWGHHIQDSLGLRGLERSTKTGALTYRESELQADCLAGAYSRDAQDRGWISAADLDAATALFAFAGDPPGTPDDDLMAHGTAEERRAAFSTGFNRGYASCGLDL